MKKILIFLGVLFGLTALAAAALLLLVDVDAQKPRIEAAVSDALDMEFKIGGPAALRFLPSPGISLGDVRVRNRGTDLAKAGSLRIGVRLIPLLRRRVEVTDFALVKPTVLIEKGKDGKFNYEISHPTPGPPPAFSVKRSAVRDGRFLYIDRQTGRQLDFDAIDLTVRDFSIGGRGGEDLLKSLSFSGDLRVRNLKAGDIVVSDIQARAKSADGKIEIRPFTMRLFGGRGEGGIDLDLSGDATAVKVRYTLGNFKAEEALSAVSRDNFLRGPMTITPNLRMRGKSAESMKRSLTGDISLRGENLVVQDLDIDEALSKIEESRKYQLADVGAFLLAGPLGTVATQGWRYGGIYSATRRGESRIARLVSDWTVSGGVAEARDVAFATAKNRIALKGGLDIANERFIDVTVAALDKKGCAKLSQKIDGPFRDPKLHKLSILQSATAPILNLLGDAKKLFTGGTCPPFYAGSVEHPGNR